MNTDYILLDYGMGRGTAFDPEQAINLVRLALEVFDEKSIALAGGLGPQSYKNLIDIFKEFPFLSCDAQGKMRTSGNAIDPIEMDLVKAYVNGVVSILPSNSYSKSSVRKKNKFFYLQLLEQKKLF